MTPRATLDNAAYVYTERRVADGETLWHDRGMSRTRISTTVDADLLATARRVRAGASDAKLIDDALTALVARHRAAEVDAAYSAYDAQPLDAPDEWGSLADFRRAAGAS